MRKQQWRMDNGGAVVRVSSKVGDSDVMGSMSEVRTTTVSTDATKGWTCGMGVLSSD